MTGEAELLSVGMRFLGASIVLSPGILGIFMPESWTKKYGYYIMAFASAAVLSSAFFWLVPDSYHMVSDQAWHSMPPFIGIAAMMFSGLALSAFISVITHALSPHSHGESFTIAEPDVEMAGEAGIPKGPEESQSEEQGATSSRDAKEGEDELRLEKKSFLRARICCDCCTLPRVVIMDLLSRILHHTVDGIVIGVQTSESSLWAVVLGFALHEIGHSIAGYGYYYNADMPKWKSVLIILSFMVVPYYSGCGVGVAISQIAASKEWFNLFAAHAATFATGIIIYIGAAELTPVVLKHKATCKQRSIAGAIAFIVTVAILITAIFVPHTHGDSHGDHGASGGEAFYCPKGSELPGTEQPKANFDDAVYASGSAPAGFDNIGALEKKTFVLSELADAQAVGLTQAGPVKFKWQGADRELIEIHHETNGDINFQLAPVEEAFVAVKCVKDKETVDDISAFVNGTKDMAATNAMVDCQCYKGEAGEEEAGHEGHDHRRLGADDHGDEAGEEEHELDFKCLCKESDSEGKLVEYVTCNAHLGHEEEGHEGHDHRRLMGHADHGDEEEHEDEFLKIECQGFQSGAAADPHAGHGHR